MNTYDMALWLTLCFLIIAVIALAHAAYVWLVNKYAPDELWLVSKPEIRTRRNPSDYEVLGDDCD